MNDMMKKIFLRFIKENRVNKEYLIKLEIDNEISLTEYVQIFDRKISWDYTKEGYNYWKFLCLKYLFFLLMNEKYINNNIKTIIINFFNSLIVNYSWKGTRTKKEINEEKYILSCINKLIYK